MLSQPFFKELEEITWKRHHSKEPTKEVRFLMQSMGVNCKNQLTPIHIDSESHVVAGFGAKRCEAAKRLGWKKVLVVVYRKD